MHRLSPHLPPILLIFGIALGIYSGTFDHAFLVNWDDQAYVAVNLDVQALSRENIYKIFSSFYVGNYAPLQMLSYMLDYQLWGGDPLAFLLVNVVLHALNGILFYLILCRLALNHAWALLAALLFVVHPVQVESVAWISQRKNVLAMSFFLVAFWHYLSYVQQGAGKWRSYVVANLFFLFALLTKSVVVIFPALLMIYDLTLRQNRGRLLDLIIEKTPFILLAVAAAGLTIKSQGEAVFSDYHGGSAFATILTMLTVYKDYLYNLFLPLQLSALYLENFKSAIDAEVLLSAFLLFVSIATLFLFRREERRSASFWLALFFLGLVPVSQIVPMMTLMNDRYLYFPMLGLSVYLLLLLQELAVKFSVPKQAAFIFAIVCILVLAPLSWQRTSVWANSISLWQDTVKKQPESSWAWSLLGDSYRQTGNFPAALESYHKALSIDPDLYQYYYELGRTYQAAGDPGNAIHSYEKVLELNPRHRQVLTQLARLYTVTLQHQAAIDLLEAVVGRGDNNGEALLSLLAANYYYQGRFPEAWRLYDQLWQRGDNNSFSVMTMLPLVALRLGEMELSAQLCQRALASGLSAADIYLDWARVEAIGQHHDQSLEFLAKALSLGFANPSQLQADPDFASLKDDPRFNRMISQ